MKHLWLGLHREEDRIMNKNETGSLDADGAMPDSFDTFYHFSPMRQSLLNWYDFRADASVLELHAGYGALTEVLCSRCKEVTAVVSDQKAENILRKRCKNNAHLTICLRERWADECLEHLDSFDYIVDLCGIEQAGQDYSGYLDRLARYLKEDGKLLLTAENRYGLRYFCGAKEKYSGLPFYGINQYFDEQGGHLFHKNELEEVFKRSVLKHYKFYYPLPDHIAPQVIFTDQYSSSTLVAERLNPYHVDQSTLIASERSLYRDIIDNGVIGFFSNSFLVECGRQENLCDIIYAVSSADRARESSFVTCVRERGYVDKVSLYPQGEPKRRELCRNIQDLEKRGIRVVKHMLLKDRIRMPDLRAPMLSQIMYEEAAKDTAVCIHLWDRLYELILRSSAWKQTAEGKILKQAYIDLVPSNILYKEQEFYVYDQEFTVLDCPAEYVLFRGIKYMYMAFGDMEDKVPAKALKSRFGLESSWEKYEERERDFIAHNRQTKQHSQFYRWADVNRWMIAKRGERIGEIVV